MKLTKDMFDFEKYDYFAGSTFSGKDPVDVFHAGAWVPPVDGACMYELARALKPKPRYNEGEKLRRLMNMERMMFALERIANVLEAHMMQHAEDTEKKERDWDNE